MREGAGTYSHKDKNDGGCLEPCAIGGFGIAFLRVVLAFLRKAEVSSSTVRLRSCRVAKRLGGFSVFGSNSHGDADQRRHVREYVRRILLGNTCLDAGQLQTRRQYAGLGVRTEGPDDNQWIV